VTTIKAPLLSVEVNVDTTGLDVGNGADVVPCVVLCGAASRVSTVLILRLVKAGKAARLKSHVSSQKILHASTPELFVYVSLH
jgi:hypothetical protein